MTFHETEKRLDELNALGSRLGLDTMRELCYRLGNPQDKIKTVHVAGTNGKGSVIAYLDSIARVAGQRSGAYTSPALENWRENIRIGGEWIDEQSAAELLTRIFEVADKMVADGFNCPTRFETETALAFLYFYEKRCDIAFIETGLGGRDDATNVIKKPELTILTSISLDHTHILGETVEQIAEVKCGIIKEGVSLVTGFQQPKVISVLVKQCFERDVICFDATPPQQYVAGDTLPYPRFKIPAKSLYQKENAYLAFGSAIALGYQRKHILQGLKKVEWFGRFSVIHKRPLFIVDGAHNPHGAERLVQSLTGKEKIIFIAGMFRDKNAGQMIQTVAPLAKKIIAIDMPENPRLLRADELKMIADKYHHDVIASVSPENAAERALGCAAGKDTIVSFGSLSTIARIAEAVREIYKGPYG